MLRAEGRDQPSSDQIGGVSQRTHNEGRLSAHPAHAPAEPLSVLEKVTCLRQEDVTGRGKGYAGVRALQEDDAQITLQLFHRPAQWGLGHVQTSSGAADMTLLGNHGEVTQQPQVHAKGRYRLAIAATRRDLDLTFRADQ